MSRARQIGTFAETAVTRTARLRGFPHADRHALHGALDTGDIRLCPEIVIEVKGGDQAKRCTDLQVQNWLDETERERQNARAAVAFLVVQRPHVGAGNAARWWAYWRLGWIADLADITRRDTFKSRHTVCRMTLGDALDLLRAAGYGEPETGL